MKRTMISAFAIAASACIAAPASAALVTFQGTGTGCYGTGCTPGPFVPGPNPGSQVTLGGLTYTDGSFNQSTTTGLLGIGGSQDNFGRFSLGTTPFVYDGQIFRLLVSFTLPNNTSPPSTFFQTILEGSVVTAQNGSVIVDFDNTPILFNSDAGAFTLRVFDVALTGPGENQILGGEIRAVPEPAAWALMLLGFGGIGMAMRRGRRSVLAQLA